MSAPPLDTPRSRTGVPERRWMPPYRWARRILWANLVAQIGIVVTGGAVRLTGSGLGCSTWPQCEPGQFAPVFHEATSWHPYIEFGNRTLTGVLGILALATAWATWRRVDRTRGFRVLGLVPLVGVLIQAVVGGLTVLLELHPAWVGLHFVLSMLLIAASTVLLVRHREDDGPRRWVTAPAARALARALLPVGAAVVVLGVVTTGAGPHSGDEDIPYRFALDPAMMARVHALSVWVYVAAVIAMVVLTRNLRGSESGGARADGAPHAHRAWVVLLGVTLAQGLIGYVQFFTGLPEVLVAAHMLGAGVLVVAHTRAHLSLRSRAVEVTPRHARAVEVSG